MTRTLSRTRREAAFLEKAKKTYAELEDWYDANPNASFGEIESEARKQRRELMGIGLEILVNGRDVGFQVEAPKCEQCGRAMEFIDYRPWQLHGLEGDSTLERAYYGCPDCKGETFFPPRAEVAPTSRPLERRRGARGNPTRAASKIV